MRGHEEKVFYDLQVAILHGEFTGHGIDAARGHGT